MNVPSSLGNIREGTCATVMELPWPWPVNIERLVFSQELDDGRLVSTAHNHGTISAQLIKDETDEILHFARSCCLCAAAPCVTFVAVVWTPDNFEIYVDGSLVASVQNTAAVPDEYQFPGNNSSRDKHDFSVDNEKAIKYRRDRMAGHGGLPVKRGRYRSNKIQTFEAVRDELLQLHDLMELVNRGAFHHATGISSIIRKMIVTGTPLPLLQYAAAAIDAPLIAYTRAKPFYELKDFPIVPLNLTRIDISANPQMLLSNPIDIDIWLPLSSSVIDRELVSNGALLKILGDTIGAHFDPDVHPAVPALRAGRSAIGNAEIDYFIQLIGSVGNVIKHLGLEVLEAGQD